MLGESRKTKDGSKGCFLEFVSLNRPCMTAGVTELDWERIGNRISIMAIGQVVTGGKNTGSRAICSMWRGVQKGTYGQLLNAKAF